MRVIAGDLRGRHLKTVPGTGTRPTSDKVKEAIFQMMGPFFQGGKGLDLFAGSGALGIEAISRGFEHIVFNDKQGKAIQIIRENLKELNIEEKSEVIRMNAYHAMRVLEKRQANFDLIFLDPPYDKSNYEELLKQIMAHNLLKKNGLIYCEHRHMNDINRIPEQLSCIKQTSYGRTIAISIYRYK